MGCAGSSGRLRIQGWLMLSAQGEGEIARFGARRQPTQFSIKVLPIKKGVRHLTTRSALFLLEASARFF